MKKKLFLVLAAVFGIAFQLAHCAEIWVDKRKFDSFDAFKKAADSGRIKNAKHIGFQNAVFPETFKEMKMEFPVLEELRFHSTMDSLGHFALKPFLESNKGALKSIATSGPTGPHSLHKVSFDGLKNCHKELVVDFTLGSGINWKNLSKNMIEFKEKYGKLPTIKYSRSMLLQLSTFFLMDRDTTYKPGFFRRFLNKIW